MSSRHRTPSKFEKIPRHTWFLKSLVNSGIKGAPLGHKAPLGQMPGLSTRRWACLSLSVPPPPAQPRPPPGPPTPCRALWRSPACRRHTAGLRKAPWAPVVHGPLRRRPMGPDHSACPLRPPRLSRSAPSRSLLNQPPPRVRHGATFLTSTGPGFRSKTEFSLLFAWTSCCLWCTP